MGKLPGYREKTVYMKPTLITQLARYAKRKNLAQYEVVEQALMRLFAREKIDEANMKKLKEQSGG